ncbi:MAG: hypothetical protein COB51_14160, partial [Moraxellaceae bacterium]
MKVRAGKEPYIADSNSHIGKLVSPWWKDLNPEVINEATQIDHSPLWAFVLGKLLSALDWIPLLGLLSLPHYFLVRKNPQSFFGDRDQWGFYNAIADKGLAEGIFKMPKTPELDSVVETEKLKLKAGKRVNLSFPSTFTPVNSAYKDLYWVRHPLRNIIAELSVHEGGPRPTIILLHGYETEMYNFNRRLFSANELYDMGCNVCLIKLPFHRRRPKSLSETTHIFRHGPAFTNEVMAHAVYDCRTMVSHLLDQQIASKVAIGGYSLGSFVGSLLVSAEQRLHSAILIDPVFHVADTFMEWPLVNRLLGRLLPQQGISLQQLRHAYACCNALTFRPAIDTTRIMVIGSLYDKLAIPRYVKLLAEHWGQCLLIWKRYSHTAMPTPRPF